MSNGILWDAARAVTWGKLIMWSTHKKKEKQINDMTTKLKSLERRHVDNDADVLKQIQYTKQILNDITESQLEKLLRFRTIFKNIGLYF